MAPDEKVEWQMSMLPIEAMEWSGDQIFEYMTGHRITDEPGVDRLVAEGLIDPCDAEGWSMGDGMSCLVARIAVQTLENSGTGLVQRTSLVPARRREMLETIDIPEHSRFSSFDIKTDEVDPADAPPHIHNRRCNWTRCLRLGYDGNHTDSPKYVFVFYENWADSALYAGNVTSTDILDTLEYLGLDKATTNFNINHTIPDIVAYNDPDPEEVREKKTARNRAKRERRKERKRECAQEKADEEEARQRERNQRNDGIEGIHKGKKGLPQLAEEEAERHRKELAETHREWERLHPKNERIAVCGESHKESLKVPKPEPCMEERVARMQFEEKRGDRRFEAEKKKADAHADKLQRDAKAKATAEREMVKQAGIRIAEAANPKAPPMTLARKAGL